MERVSIGTLTDFPEKVGKVVRVRQREIAVFRLEDGRLTAVENRCPHRGGPLAEGIVCGEHVFCPLHDWKINLRDGQVEEPDKGCVKTYSVEIEGERVYFRF